MFQELIRDGQNGLLFEAGNASDLARVVLGAMGQRDTWTRYWAVGRRDVEEERNWSASVANYQAVYGALVEANS